MVFWFRYKKKLENLKDIDLSNYYTKTEVDNLLKNINVDLSEYYTKNEIAKILLEYYDKKQIDAHINDLNTKITHLQNDKLDKQVFKDFVDNDLPKKLGELQATTLQDANQYVDSEIKKVNEKIDNLPSGNGWINKIMSVEPYQITYTQTTQITIPRFIVYSLTTFSGAPDYDVVQFIYSGYQQSPLTYKYYNGNYDEDMTIIMTYKISPDGKTFTITHNDQPFFGYINNVRIL